MGVGADLMARMTIKGIDEFAFKLSKLGSDAPKIAKKVVMAGAKPVADEIRKNLTENINDPQYAGVEDGKLLKQRYRKSLRGLKNSSGSLLESFGIAPPDVDHKGNTNTHIGFEGYDDNGVPNALKARAMESGTSTLRKRPFVRPAVNKMRKKSIDEMGKKLDEEIKIYAL
jgi:HK97 gp10 family phage protein